MTEQFKGLELKEKELNERIRYLEIKEKGTRMTLKKIIDCVHRFVPDPAYLVLKMIRCLYGLLKSGSVSKEFYSSNCIALSKTVMNKTSLGVSVRNDAMKFSIVWKCFLIKQGDDTDPMDVFSFLFFLGSFGLKSLCDKLELLTLFGELYIKTEVPFSGQDNLLRHMFGSEKKFSGMFYLPQDNLLVAQFLFFISNYSYHLM